MIPKTDADTSAPENARSTREGFRKAVAYLRVSQEDETVENQKNAIIEWAKRNGFEIVATFKDEDVSGAVPPRLREGYRAMLKFCKDNGISTIIFYDLSRLSRSLEDGIIELKQLTSEGFIFFFAGQDFLNHIKDPLMKKKVVSDFLWFAELYREDIIRRTKEALKRLKKEGKVLGRPTIYDAYALYLFKKDKYNQLTSDERKKAKELLLKQIKEWRNNGASIKTIMHLLKEEFKKVNSYLQSKKLKPFHIAYATVYELVKELERREADKSNGLGVQ